MVTTTSSTPSPAVQDGTKEGPGFVGLLVKSIFEPGVNPAVVMAMNVSFFLLVLTLFALAYLTKWNPHVLMLMVVSTLLWGAMMWFVIEITRVQTRSDNVPLDTDTLMGDGLGSIDPVNEGEVKKDR